jgi:hypothetical protein
VIRLTGSQRTGAATRPHSLDGLSVTTRDCGSRATTPMRVASGFRLQVSRPRLRPVPLVRLPLRDMHARCRIPRPESAAILKPIVIGAVDVEYITAHADELLRHCPRRRRHHHCIHCPEEALGLSKPEPTREEPVRGRPHQATRFTLDLIKNPDRRCGANLVLNKGEAGYFTALANLLQSHPSASRSEGIQNDLQTHPRTELSGRRCFVQR